MEFDYRIVYNKESMSHDIIGVAPIFKIKKDLGDVFDYEQPLEIISEAKKTIKEALIQEMKDWLEEL